MKLTRESLQNLYPMPSDAFMRETADMLHRLPTLRKEKKMKKKLSASLILAFALMLCAFSALAASLDWNVMDFLFGDREHAAKQLVQNVDARASDGQVTLTIDSAITDGETLAMDWTIVNEDTGSPVFVMVDAFTANGVRIGTDGNDSFDDEWLPGLFSRDGSMQDGEIIELPQAVRDSDTLDVVMTVGVYHPALPLYLMDEFDAALAGEKIEQGYLVVPEGEGLAIVEEGEVVHVFGRIPDGMPESFTRTELTVSFSLDMKVGRESVRPLKTQALYETELFTARYTKAEVSLMGLRLEMDIFCDDVDWRFKLTDEHGEPLDTPWPAGDMLIETAEDGSPYFHLHETYFGLTEDMLPDVFSLTYFPEDGEPVLLPVRVR